MFFFFAKISVFTFNNVDCRVIILTVEFFSEEMSKEMKRIGNGVRLPLNVTLISVERLFLIRIYLRYVSNIFINCYILSAKFIMQNYFFLEVKRKNDTSNDVVETPNIAYDLFKEYWIYKIN